MKGILMVKTGDKKGNSKTHKKTLDFQVDIIAMWPKNVEQTAYDIYSKLVKTKKYTEFAREKNPLWRNFYSRVITSFKLLEKSGDIVFIRHEESQGSWPKSVYKRVK